MAIGFKSRTGEIVRACESVDIPCGIIAGGDDVSGFLSLNTQGIVPGEYITAIGIPCVVDEAESDEWARIPAWLQPISKTKPFEEQFEARSGVSADEMPEEVVIDEATKYLDGEALSDEEKQQAVEMMTALIYHEFTNEDKEEDGNDDTNEKSDDLTPEEKAFKATLMKLLGFNTKEFDRLYAKNVKLNQRLADGKFDKDTSMWILKEFCKPKLLENGMVYLYNEELGGYVGGDQNIRTTIRQKIASNARPSDINDMLQTLYDELWSDITADDTEEDYVRGTNTLKRDERYIWFRNGLYDIKNDEMVESNPDVIVTNRIPFDYNPDAKCDLVDQFLKNIQPDDEVRRVLIEFVGYCMFAGYPEHKAAFLIGNGKNGKSTFLDFVRHILSEKNVAGLGMDKIQERFAIGMSLIGRSVNICDDMGSGFIRMPENFKKLASGSKVVSEIKGGAVSDVNPNVKLMFSANEMPRIADGSFGSERRILIIPFDVRFDEADKEMPKKLMSKEAIEYMIALAVKGLRDLIERDFEFDEPDVCQVAKHEYMKINTPILGFIESYEEEYGADCFIDRTVADVYDSYCEYCTDANVEKLGKNKFSKELQERVGIVSVTNRVGNVVSRIYKRKAG